MSATVRKWVGRSGKKNGNRRRGRSPPRLPARSFRSVVTDYLGTPKSDSDRTATIRFLLARRWIIPRHGRGKHAVADARQSEEADRHRRANPQHRATDDS